MAVKKVAVFLSRCGKRLRLAAEKVMSMIPILSVQGIVPILIIIADSVIIINAGIGKRKDRFVGLQ